MGSLYCPSCGSELLLDGDIIYCPLCKESWSVSDGVPIFTGDNNVNVSFGLLPDSEDVRFLRAIKKYGFSEAVERVFSKNPLIRARIFNSFIRSYVWLNDSGNFSTCLEIGPGYGALVEELSHVCDTVYAVEVVPTRAKIVQERMRWANADNVVVVSTDALNIPLKDSTLDVIYMVGVLEWLPISYQGDPRDVQVMALQYLRSKLRDGGKLIVGIENRFGAQYFAGWPDHNGLRFTSVLPRWLADAYSRMRGRGPYRVRTYSYWGYRDLFREAGFRRVELFGALRSYRFPRYVVSTAQDSLRTFFDDVYVPKTKWDRLLAAVFKRLPVTLQRLLMPHFIIRATR